MIYYPGWRNQSVNIQKIEKITDETYLNLYRIDYSDRKDQKKTWVYASRNKSLEMGNNQKTPNAVVIVPFHVEKQKLIVIREFRVTLNGWQYGFPAGLVEEDEDLISAARRELMEETGLELTRVTLKSPVIYSSPGVTDESLCIMYVECKGSPSGQFLEDSEDIEVMMVSRKEAGQLLADPSLKFDVKAWMVLKDYARMDCSPMDFSSIEGS